MTISQAIQKAIEGGWIQWHADRLIPISIVPDEIIANLYLVDWGKGDDPQMVWLRDMVLDPLFWSALGKKMGWKQEKPTFHWAEIELARRDVVSASMNGADATAIILFQQLERMMKDKKEVNAWLYHWHRLIDALSEGKSIEQFFTEPK